MHQVEISLESVNPMEFMGKDEANWRCIKAYFPTLSLVARGNVVRAKGTKTDLGRFEEVLNLLIWHLERYQRIDEDDVMRLLKAETGEVMNKARQDDTILYGVGGNRISARTPNQHKLVEAIRNQDMVFAIGPAGTGKTYTAVAMAVAALKDKRVKRIILTRPAVEAGENLGFLPGDLKEKLDPYLQPLYDALFDMLPHEKLVDHMEKGVIEVAPLAFMRGRTLDKAFVILDEAQNTTVAQMKMFLTRMGKEAKFVITGDASQVDLPRKQQSGLSYAVRALKSTEGLQFIALTGDDVVRHRLVQAVIKAFEETDLEIEAEEQRKAVERRAARAAKAHPSDESNS
jgi:phosphate starvation-inducible PhoH-like protein